ncbi:MULTISPECIES: glycosyltransferase [unclassified Phyllobacterium]|uniref:glycosyltransferase n=1 Tax=unclassified Phyllobacterium TaxID=2638441 RepID=UPI00301300C2
MTERRLEPSIAARLCYAGLPKTALVEAFTRYRQNGTSFIEELYAVNGIDHLLLTQCLAEEAGLVFENIDDDLHIISPSGAEFVDMRHRRHIVGVTADFTLKIYTAPTLSTIARIKQGLVDRSVEGPPVNIISPARLTQFFLAKHSDHLVRNAVNMLENGPRHSARTVADGQQGVIIGMIITVCLFLAMLAPNLLWQASHALFSLLFMGCILLRFLAGRHASNQTVQLMKSTGGSLPKYTVMVALYKEAEVVPQLVEAMKQLDWPRSRLEVLFLCETDDYHTRAAFEKEMLPASFKIICVPCTGPRTKPKALNYGLQLAEGDYVVIYDAEDRPHPDQLREAWQRFSESTDGKLACLQAPLVITNERDSWIARQFAFEYAAHFRGLLPWLADGRFVVPLGGTSNHFRRECLVEVGGWDPFNVTEDAELGSRFARHGYRIEMLSLPTAEDAPIEVGIWLKQRTRWLKGWMQTWLVEMRQPREMLQRAGLKRFLVYHVLTAGVLGSALLFPFMVLFVSYMLLMITLVKSTGFAGPILIFDLMNIVSGFLSFHSLGRAALKKEKMSGWILPGLPIYWALISLAAWRALWQLYVAPFLWEKTPHRPVHSAISFK